MFKDSVSIQELKAILVAQSNADTAKSVAIQNRLRRVLDDTVLTEDPMVIIIRTDLTDYLADIIARRMKMRRRTRPLVSLRDISKFTLSAIEFIEKQTSEKISDEERADVETLVDSTFGNMLETINDILPIGTNLYDSYWKWAETVFAVAKEKNVSPVMLYQSDDANEVTRRLFTKDQFATLMKKAGSKALSIRTIYKLNVLPLITLEAGNDKSKFKKLKLYYRASTLPVIKENIAKTRPFMRAIIKEEIARIYGR